MSAPTAHIGAEIGAFAKTVLMPGDPLRAKFIAENFLESPKLINEIRGMLAYTGSYKGSQVSVMGSGMGCASIGIYSYELFNFYDVDNIIRIGSAGSINKDLQLGDVVMGVGACVESDFVDLVARCPGTFAPTASFDLMFKAKAAAEKVGVTLRAGNLLTTDVFYGDDPDSLNAWLSMGVLAVEMEAAALYTNAARAGKNALALCTISDKVFDRNDLMTAKERETSLTQMIELGLSMI